MPIKGMYVAKITLKRQNFIWRLQTISLILDLLKVATFVDGVEWCVYHERLSKVPLQLRPHIRACAPLTPTD